MTSIDNFSMPQTKELMDRLGKIESLLSAIIQQKTIKEWYTTKEIAELLNKAEFTVREWCRHGRIIASKKQCGRGVTGEWIVSHDELIRLKNEGLRKVVFNQLHNS